MASVCLCPDPRSPVFNGQSCTISIHFFFWTTFLPVPIFMFQFFVEGLTFSADTGNVSHLNRSVCSLWTNCWGQGAVCHQRGLCSLVSGLGFFSLL